MLGLGGEGLGAGLLAGGPRPSYFELFAQEWLMAGLRPAMRYVTAFFAPRHPFMYRVHGWNDEIFTALLGPYPRQPCAACALSENSPLGRYTQPVHLAAFCWCHPVRTHVPAPACAVLLEWTHLRTKDGTMAESFFGLKRVRYRAANSGGPPGPLGLTIPNCAQSNGIDLPTPPPADRELSPQVRYFPPGPPGVDPPPNIIRFPEVMKGLLTMVLFGVGLQGVGFSAELRIGPPLCMIPFCPPEISVPRSTLAERVSPP
jgi:hypothetical protein